MSWHYLQEQEAESLEPICLDGDPLPQLKSKTTHAECYCNGKLMESYLDSLSGTTLAPLMEPLGEGKSMSSPEDSPAKTLAQPEKEQESKENDQDSGAKWLALSMRYDPDTFLLKTHHCLFPEDLPLSSVTLPKWGMMRDGELWERITSPPLTSETESGYLLPTPDSSERGPCKEYNPSAASQSARTLQTLAACDPHGKMFPTPLKSDYKRRGPASKQQGLPEYIKAYPTPQSRDWKGTAGGFQKGNDLPGQIGGQLNPTWVEWLMGWCIEWTDLKPLEMDKFQQWLDSHGIS